MLHDPAATAAEYRDLIVAYRNGQPVKIREIANVIDGVENDKTANLYNNERSIVLSNWRLRRGQLKNEPFVGGGDATILGCGPIAPLVERRSSTPFAFGLLPGFSAPGRPDRLVTRSWYSCVDPPYGFE
jgi:hypothetical protein